jgi:hypothetical protein
MDADHSGEGRQRHAGVEAHATDVFTGLEI